MKFPNIFSKFNKPKTQPESARTDWERNGEEQPFTGEQAPDPEAKRQERLARQGDKLILMYYQGEGAIAGKNEVTVSPAMREDFYNRLGRIGFAAEESRLLQKIVPPFGTPEKPNYQTVFARINNQFGRDILSQMEGVEESKLSPDALEDFLKGAPTPVEFDAMIPDYKASLMQKNLGYGITDYEEYLETFQRQVYGKRYEYYEALKEMESKVQTRNKARADVEVALARQKEAQHQIEHPPALEDMQRAWDNGGYTPPEAQ